MIITLLVFLPILAPVFWMIFDSCRKLYKDRVKKPKYKVEDRLIFHETINYKPEIMWKVKSISSTDYQLQTQTPFHHSIIHVASYSIEYVDSRSSLYVDLEEKRLKEFNEKLNKVLS